MRRTVIVPLSLPCELVEEIDKLVKKDNRCFHNRSHCFTILAQTGLNNHKQGRELVRFIDKLFGEE